MIMRDPVVEGSGNVSPPGVLYRAPKSEHTGLQHSRLHRKCRRRSRDLIPRPAGQNFLYGCLEAKVSRPGAFPLLGAPLDSPLHYGGMLYLGKTLEHGISCMVANSGRLRGSRHSLATWSFSSVEPILRSSLDPANDDEDLYNWMARQRGPSSPLDSPSSRSAPRESAMPTGGIPDAQTVFEPLLQLLGACTVALQTPGPRLALSTLVELLRVDLVESESLEQPQRRRSKPGQRLFVDTSTDTPALVCDRLALELDVRHPGNPGTCAHVAVDVQYVAQQVNMPLLRLLNQFSSMYENVKETRLELQCRRPRADSVVVPMPQPHPGGSHESVAPVQTSTPRCWKTMCFLLDLYETMPPSQALADSDELALSTRAWLEKVAVPASTLAMKAAGHRVGNLCCPCPEKKTEISTYFEGGCSGCCSYAQQASTFQVSTRFEASPRRQSLDGHISV
ncbi:hypothetical protein HPB51_013102 [Rhipicephalus microplus]|uniref:Uncharacterized protein n=1 Tax=Rhipicephalus microplus TaxID=6941 RepID=A0A9J6F322_RHIMP|nr:hypothetical protein HPB51_013102 [Rhipicephalus microplus]